MVKAMKRQMNAARSEFVRGLSSLLDLSSPPPRERRRRKNAMSSLRADMEKIGADFHRVIDRERGNEEAAHSGKAPVAAE